MSTETGQRAEAAAAVYVQKLGQRVLARNWRNKWCEIDLVTRDRAGLIHIVEVKYRASSAWGSGFEYITADKARRLRRAAAAWMATQRQESDYQIDVVAVGAELAIDYLPNAIGG